MTSLSMPRAETSIMSAQCRGASFPSDVTRVPPDHFGAAKAVLAMPAGDWPERLAAVLARHYGWTGTINPVSSEAEQTALLERSGTAPLILKISSRPEGAESFRFQSAMLAGLEGSDGFDVPRLIRTDRGQPGFEEDGLTGYVQTAVEGVQLSRAAIGPTQLHQAGRALGALDAALAGLVLPGQDRPVLWNIGCWPGLLDFLPYVADASTADLVRDAMQRYVESALPLLPELPWQVTHNDPSPHNMFVDGDRIAFIDFGDGGWAPRLQDLAVAASHFVLDPASALGGAEALIAGYAAIVPLSPLDARMLVPLIRARQAALILVNAWRAALFPAEADYINKNVGRAKNGLSILARLGASDAATAVLAAAATPKE
ncbi:MAG: phosphotransferase [Janthinobacterium lividum]